MDEKDTRVRNWSWIVYPESAPENWKQLLDETGEKWIESPLHDKDERFCCKVSILSTKVPF